MVIHSYCILLIGTGLCEENGRVLKATTTVIWIDISSTESNCIYLVRVLAISGIVEPIINCGVGVEGGEELIEVFLIDTVTGVVTIIVITKITSEGWLPIGMNNEHQNGREEEQ